MTRHNGTTDKLSRLAAGRGWGTFPCSHADRRRVADRIRQLGRQEGATMTRRDESRAETIGACIMLAAVILLALFG